jgi:hypothetical protein
MLHVKFGKDLASELFLVDGEEFSVSPPADVTAQEPFGVATVSDSKLVLELHGSKVRFRFGVGCKE